MRKLVILAALAGLAMLVVGSFAIAGDNDSKNARGDMNGYQEVPSISTTGLGTFMARISNDETRIDYVLTYSGLETPITQSHIHFGQRSVNGGISVFLCNTPGFGPPAGTPAPPACQGTTAGTVEGSVTPAHVIGPNGQGIEPVTGWAELLRAIRVGHAYANIHTTRFPGGEIRGQLNDENQREFLKGNSVGDTQP
jgi:CHRD domain